MIHNYRHNLLSCVVVFAAVVGHCLGQALPGTIAAPAGTVAGFMWGLSNDQVSRRFQSDVENALQPNEAMKLAAIFALITGVLCASALSFSGGSGVSAASGVLISMAMVWSMLR